MASLVEMSTGHDGGKPLTGRTVLYWLAGFFGAMFIANGFFVYFAVSSFPGVEVDSAYTAGRQFSNELEAGKAQNALGWDVTVTRSTGSDGQLILTVEPRDKDGNIVSGLTVAAKLRNLRGPQYDTAQEFTEIESGLYRAEFGVLSRGQWTMELDALRGEDRVYRTVSKMILK